MVVFLDFVHGIYPVVVVVVVDFAVVVVNDECDDYYDPFLDLNYYLVGMILAIVVTIADQQA